MRTFASGCQCLSRSEFHYTMLGVGGASGEDGDSRLSAKQKGKSFDELPTVGNAETPAAGQKPQESAAEPPPAPAVEVQRHSRLPASAKVVACTRPGSPER